MRFAFCAYATQLGPAFQFLSFSTITSMGCRLVARQFCWTATAGLACSPASTVCPGLGHKDM